MADGWVKVPYENEVINSLALVDLWIQDPNQNWSLNRITNQFQAWQEDISWGKYEFELDNLIGFAPGKYVLWGQAFYGRSDVEPSSQQITRFTVDNAAPTELLFELKPSFGNSLYSPVDTIKLKDAWIKDFNGAGDVDRVDFWLQREDGTWQDLKDATGFKAWSEGKEWSSFDYELDLSNLDLANDSQYTLWARAYDNSGEASDERMINFNTTGKPVFFPQNSSGEVNSISQPKFEKITYEPDTNIPEFAQFQPYERKWYQTSSTQPDKIISEDIPITEPITLTIAITVQ